MRVDATEELHRLVLQRPWRSVAGIAWLIFLPFVLFVLVLMASLFLASRDLGSQLFGWGLIALGIANVYLAIAMVVNTTEVELTRDALSTQHGPMPLPFKGCTVVRRADISSLETFEMYRHPWNGVRARLKDGGEATVFTSFHADEAEFVREQLAAKLK